MTPLNVHQVDQKNELRLPENAYCRWPITVSTSIARHSKVSKSAYASVQAPASWLDCPGVTGSRFPITQVHTATITEKCLPPTAVQCRVGVRTSRRRLVHSGQTRSVWAVTPGACTKWWMCVIVIPWPLRWGKLRENV